MPDKIKHREYTDNGGETARRDIAAGRNAVLELLKSEKPVDTVYIRKDLTGSVVRIAAMAREQGITVKETDVGKLDSMCPGVNHQGVVAVLAEAAYAELEDIFERAGDSAPFIVIADEIEDPHNLGAIIRTAEAAGAHGLIIPKRRSAGLTFAVSKASAGALSHLPVVRVANIAQVLDTLKERGLWLYAADMGGKSWHETDFSGPVGLVIGSEGKGIGRLVREKCDFAVSLPMFGKIGSLNASVAAGIIMYEIAKQRMNSK